MNYIAYKIKIKYECNADNKIFLYYNAGKEKIECRSQYIYIFLKTPIFYFYLNAFLN